MTWIVLVLLIVLFAVLAWRLNNLSARLDDIVIRSLDRLTERVRALESQARPTAPLHRPAPEQARAATEPAAPSRPPPRPVPVQATPPPAPVRPPVPVHAAAEPRRREWEALIGGNLLNKAGVLVTVIGIALFLGYSFSQLSPGGRIVLASLVSVSLLVAGFLLERRPRYTIFARGLIGGGWAAIYFTAYAAHGVEAARVIHSPVIASCLLALISIACILHSLHYRSQVVTGLGYFVAFITLAITPLSTFAMVALVPLAASLLYLSHRFTWTAMALPGLLVTYGLYFAHAAGSQEGNLWAGETLLLVYWVLSEGFDIIAARKDRNAVRSLLFPANAVAFLGLSWLQCNAAQPEALWICSSIAAIVFLGSVLIRVATAVGYNGALAVAAGVTAVAFYQGLDGIAVTYALLVEAELLFLAGLWTREPFLHRLSDAVFVLTLGKLALADVFDGSLVAFAGTSWHVWTPLAVLAAVSLYADRALAPTRQPYGYAAAALAVFALGSELPSDYIAVGWIAFAVVLLELGVFWRLVDFRYQAFAVGVASLVPLALRASVSSWEAVAIAVALLAFAAARLDGLCRTDHDSALLAWPRSVATSAAAAELSMLLWRVLPESYVVLGWAALALGLVGSARIYGRRGLRFISYALATVTFVRCWAVNLGVYDFWFAVGVIAAFYAAVVLCPRSAESVTDWRGWIDLLGRPGFSILAGVLLAVLLTSEVSGSVLTVAWGCQGVLLLAAGFLLRDRGLRLPGLVLLVGCILKLFLYDLRNLETPARIASFLVLGVILIGVSWTYTRFRERPSRFL